MSFKKYITNTPFFNKATCVTNPSHLINYVKYKCKLKIESIAIILEERANYKKEEAWKKEIKEASYRPTGQSVLYLETPARRTTKGKGQTIADKQYYGQPQ